MVETFGHFALWLVAYKLKYFGKTTKTIKRRESKYLDAESFNFYCGPYGSVLSGVFFLWFFLKSFIIDFVIIMRFAKFYLLLYMNFISSC